MADKSAKRVTVPAFHWNLFLVRITTNNPSYKVTQNAKVLRDLFLKNTINLGRWVSVEKISPARSDEGEEEVVIQVNQSIEKKIRERIRCLETDWATAIWREVTQPYTRGEVPLTNILSGLCCGMLTVVSEDTIAKEGEIGESNSGQGTIVVCREGGDEIVGDEEGQLPVEPTELRGETTALLLLLNMVVVRRREK